MAREAVRLAVTVAVDPDEWDRLWNAAAPELGADVEDYVVELLSVCKAAAQGAWEVTRVEVQR